MTVRRFGWIGTGHAETRAWQPDKGTIRMTETASVQLTILVDDEVFDVLSRTAQTRETDINGVLRHLLLDRPAPAQPSDDEDEVGNE